ncbi:MAG: S8 family serine peptidase, partial [Chlorobi bacterium]|nr:S8 family serine peptidase [Chlorobiota bacterium]
MKKLFTILLTLGMMITAMAQIAPDKYYVQFTDKDNSPYSIDNPSEFLTQRAIDRRAKYSIVITNQDLPVNPQYITGVAATGAKLLNSTRWMNGITIYTTEQSVLDAINALPYVESIAKMNDRTNTLDYDKFKNESFGDELKPDNLKESASISSYDYGFAINQIEQLNGVLLHDQGFRGEGMVIAVLDAGYDVVKTQPLFDSLWANDQILGSKDFVYTDANNVYAWHYHGRMVLSCMGANIEGLMVGTAPKASYWLLRSEDGASENIIEEYNWVSAAEFADSVGADVINSSLGYIDFDNPFWDHTYDDMNGSTAVVTLGADIAASKGIMVVNSAGNSGQNPGFPWIGAPADGFDVFSIGAVDGDGNRAEFSSIG